MFLTRHIATPSQREKCLFVNATSDWPGAMLLNADATRSLRNRVAIHSISGQYLRTER